MPCTANRGIDLISIDIVRDAIGLGSGLGQEGFTSSGVIQTEPAVTAVTSVDTAEAVDR